MKNMKVKAFLISLPLVFALASCNGVAPESKKSNKKSEEETSETSS